MVRMLDVDPRTLVVSPQRPTGAKPDKLQREIAIHGRSMAGMLPVVVYEDPDGRLVIWDGVDPRDRNFSHPLQGDPPLPLPADLDVGLVDVLLGGLARLVLRLRIFLEPGQQLEGLPVHFQRPLGQVVVEERAGGGLGQVLYWDTDGY